MTLGWQILTILLLGAGLSWALGFAARWLAWRWKAVDQPTGGRKIHDRVIPLFGGLAPAVVISLGTVLMLWCGWLSDVHIANSQIIGFLVGLVLVTLVGALDDRYDLSPWLRLSLYGIAAAIIVLSGSTVHEVTRWQGVGGFSLVWWQWGMIHLPSDLIAWMWLMLVMLAIKFSDGLDGLVTGQTIIGSAVIAGLALTTAYFQPSVGLLAMLVLAAFLGFFPHNAPPAKQFLGESGSVLAGFTIAFLSIVSGTKVATALMVIALPMIDIILVFAGRLRRGMPLWVGDRTHLHHKLIAAGLSPKQAVAVFWFISIIFGAAALGLQTRGKVTLLAVLVLVTIGISFLAGWFAKQKHPL